MSAFVNPPEQVGVVDTALAAKSTNDKRAPKSSVGVVNIALRVLEGIGLIFANIVTLGLINFLPGIHKEYGKVFGGKEVEVISEQAGVAEIDSDSEDEGDLVLPRQVVADPNLVQNDQDNNAGKARGPIIRDGQEGFEDDDVVQDHACQKLADSATYYSGKVCDGVVSAYQGANKENAQRAWDKTVFGTTWVAGYAKHGAQVAWREANRENATMLKDVAVRKTGEIYEAAKKPENLRTTVGTIVGLAATTIGTAAYLYSGGSPEQVASAVITVATNGTV